MMDPRKMATIKQKAKSNETYIDPVTKEKYKFVEIRVNGRKKGYIKAYLPSGMMRVILDQRA